MQSVDQTCGDIIMYEVVVQNDYGKCNVDVVSFKVIDFLMQYECHGRKVLTN